MSLNGKVALINRGIEAENKRRKRRGSKKGRKEEMR